MRLEKRLVVDSFTSQRVRNAPFVLKAGENVLTFDRETLKKFGLSPSRKLVGKDLIVILKSRKIKYNHSTIAVKPLTDLKDNDVLIRRVEKKETHSKEYSLMFPEINKVEYRAFFSTGFFGNYGSEFPCPFYDLDFEINEKEYQELKKLPKNTVMNVGFSLE
ncbi:hypothetical protein DRN73_01585 [Candidatus Pacearchaeota archaeon]|nr:MAG: hypothetical protein DRN73_01585 [Candidatus Pacearchaeota archaeon]